MPLKYISTLLLGLVAITVASPLLDVRAVSPSVTLSSGVVVGTATAVLNQPSVTGLVDAYLGIPYADTPKRFEPPVAYSGSWTTPFAAQKFGDACIQQINTTDYPSSENCLFVNIYVPPNTIPSSQKPVMFWIHGGDLAIGAGSNVEFNASSLAVNHDVVVVTFNYRLSIFGFPNAPELRSSTPNPGFLDQRLALQWARDNINAFGGDKSHITIFGESAGGYSVAQILALPPKPLPFVAAIMESPIYLLPGDGSKNWNNVSSHFGCDVNSSLACLQKVDATELLNYIRSAGISLLWPPVTDGITQAGSISDAISAGSFADVPVYMGTNTQELDGLLSALGLGNDNANNATAILTKLLGTNITALVALVGPKYNDDPPVDLIGQILTDLLFTCPVARFARELALNNYDTWRYWYGLATATYGSKYVVHASEVAQVFGSYPLANEKGVASEDQIQLSALMQTIWTDFAKNPYAGPGWPKISKSVNNKFGLLGGARNSSGLQVIPTFTADYPCGILDGLAATGKVGILEVGTS
ncbi:hypothetical protein AUEXF2481DRAFT_89063 [Aureobasidium subglaciale EXF-2481]|uniref:Carboxylic ester hydrolase n=1 Tax=Aureobasidium subglaciale (strain EXF-2481) TaxID=1043005 RepID=A0A074Z801_AURSE|nr:uncharacterized protein AUEXF2481DRAFT_89063 [Aureobasidium subglaciale EXF-2481]KEQ95001.1 hypothetical protein AUEXF2481DRAFT_89063 [Aureobasidium subglaciale EXF-2481]